MNTGASGVSGASDFSGLSEPCVLGFVGTNNGASGLLGTGFEANRGASGFGVKFEENRGTGGNCCGVGSAGNSGVCTGDGVEKLAGISDGSDGIGDGDCDCDGELAENCGVVGELVENTDAAGCVHICGAAGAAGVETRGDICSASLRNVSI